jgi:hypothetical protein
MIHLIKKLAISLPLLLLVTVTLPAATAVAIDEGAKNAACAGLAAAGDDCDTAESNSEIESIIAGTINILSLLVGVAAVMMVIVGGFKYVTSNGDSNKIASAKTTIMYAILGLVVAVSAQMIVRFVLKQTTTDTSSQQVGTQNSSLQ